MENNKDKKLKILALHGYGQNANRFKEKNAISQKFKKIANFFFVTAPFKVVPEENHREQVQLIEHTITDTSGAYTIKEELIFSTDYPDENTESFAWYLRKHNESKTGYYYRGFKECIQYLEVVFKEQGPFDGIFGFSQGAILVAILSSLQQKQLTNHIKFGFAIIASGCKERMDCFYDDALIKIPSLHIYGKADQIILPERSENLAKCFENAVVICHPGGHFIPCNAEMKKLYTPFFLNQLNSKFACEK